MRIGAFDFLEKPFNPDRMSDLAKKATNARRLTLDNRALRRELGDGTQMMRKLIGSSPAMERLREDILDLGQADGHVLIDGETGTGKTLVAHALHAVGSRAGKKFVLISCAAMDEDTLIRRLFGPMMPEDNRLPAVEEARGGTLVLEDIEALSDTAQARLLTMINDQGTPPETRIVAICNLQDEGRTCEDALRPDLYYRLAALKITAPPLRNRGEDILTLFTALADQFADEYGCDAPQVSAQEAAQLLQAPWPGNVRQLINLAERAVLQSRRGTGTIASLLMSDHDEMQPVMTTEGKPLKEYVEAFERMLIDNTMRRHRGSIASVMDELCLPRRTLNEKMAKYGLQRSDYL
jgi:DNA-binding NtrC family response regulator